MTDSKDLIPTSELVRSITTYAKGKLKWKLETLPATYLTQSAEELEKSQKLTDTDKKLRIAFHDELARASRDSDNIVIANICKGICHSNSFLVKLDDPKKLAWLILPYQDEKLKISHQVNQAHDTMECLLDLPLYVRDPQTNEMRVDYKAAELKYKVAKLIYDRAYPATQKIKYSSDKEDDQTKKLVDLDDQIKLLEEKLKGKNGQT